MQASADLPAKPPRRKFIILAIAAVIGLVVAGGIYGIEGFGRNPADAACKPAVETAKRIAPLVRGEVGYGANSGCPRGVGFLPAGFAR